MRRSYLALLPIGAVVCATLFAQQPPPPPPAGQALSPDQLEGLVASTYPLELVQVPQWLALNPGLNGPGLTHAAQQQNWDPSIQALVVFPDLVEPGHHLDD